MTANIKLCWTKQGNSYTRRYPVRKIDRYGFVVKSLRRHKDCTCDVPCQARWDCEAIGHKGRRATPFCNGQIDDKPGHCDTCWDREHNEET